MLAKYRHFVALSLLLQSTCTRTFEGCLRRRVEPGVQMRGEGDTAGAKLVRLLLASSSAAALLIGGGAPSAFAAACKITQTGGTAASISNSSATGNCILVQAGASVTGNVTNTSSGVLTTNGAAPPSQTGITINNSTVRGTVSNAGTITAQHSGIVINNNAIVSGGISNSGTISAAAVFNEVLVSGVSTFSGGITNSGTMSGGVVGIFVNNVSTFTGNVVNNGTLDAGDNGIFVSGGTTFAGSISNGGTISVGGAGIEVSSLSVFTSGITNSGAITSKSGTGISIGSVANFSGGITNSNTITAGADGIAVSGVTNFSGGISNTKTITAVTDGIFVTNVSTFAGNITNAGAITGKTGILIGPGVTFAAGGAVVNSGTITGTGGNAINVSGASSAVTIDQNSGLISGNVMLSPNADVVNIAGGTIDGNVVGAGGLNTVNFNLGSGTFTYGAAFGFHGINLVNVNSGTVILDGSNNANTVNVTGGNLEVGDAANPGAILGALSLLDVTGGILSGHGTIFAPVVIESGGTLFPGGTLGTLTISGGVNPGNLTFNPGSTYGIELTPTQHSMTVVKGLPGTVTINGGEVELTPHLGTYAASSFAILTSTGTLTGQFDPTITYTGSFHLNDATLSYDAHDVFLSYGQTFSTLVLPPGATINQINVATGINNFILSGGTPPAPFQTLVGFSGPSLLNALNQIDGENATAAEGGAFDLMNEFLELMLQQGWGDGVGNHSGLLDYAPLATKAPPLSAFDQRWHVWAAGFGGGRSTDGDPVVVGSHDTTTTTYGFASGMDYHPTPDSLYGFALSGAGLNWGLVDALGTGRADAFQAGVYGRHFFGPAYVEGALAFANDWFSTTRTALGEPLQANFTGQSYGMRFESGYRYAAPFKSANAGVTPYAAVQTQWFHTPTYSETNPEAGGFGLTYNSQNANDTRTELGARFDDLTSLAAGQPVLLRARLAWAHDFVNDPSLSAAFQALPGSNFTVFGAPLAHDSALTSASAEWWIRPNLSFTAKFDGEFASGSQTYAGNGVLRYTW